MTISHFSKGDTNDTSKNRGEDNMRDIGTWSNEQIAKGPKRNQANNEEDNEEEWQGDLTQTQIFTATNQRKESNENK